MFFDRKMTYNDHFHPKIRHFKQNQPVPLDVLDHMMLKLTVEQIEILHNLALTKFRHEAEQIDEYRVRILQNFQPKLLSVAESEGFEAIDWISEKMLYSGFQKKVE